jgi:hypothetical protein
MADNTNNSDTYMSTNGNSASDQAHHENTGSGEYAAHTLGQLQLAVIDKPPQYEHKYRPYLEEAVTYNVYVGGLGDEVDENDLFHFFSPCGPIDSCRVFRAKDEGFNKLVPPMLMSGMLTGRRGRWSKILIP